MRLPAKSRLRRILRRLPLRTRVFQRENTNVRVPTRGATALLESGRKRPQDDEGTEAIGPPDGECRAGVAAAIPDYSITSMSGSFQERSK